MGKSREGKYFRGILDDSAKKNSFYRRNGTSIEGLEKFGIEDGTGARYGNPLNKKGLKKLIKKQELDAKNKTISDWDKTIINSNLRDGKKAIEDKYGIDFTRISLGL